MLRILGHASRACDGIARRDFLRLGMLAPLAASVPLVSPRRAAAESTPASSFGRAKRCIVLFLTGGPPQHDTFDPKPDAPAEIRGEFRPMATSVAGIQVSELFPKLAAQADKFCIVRSVTHRDPAHTSAGYSMLTGLVHPKAGKETRPVQKVDREAAIQLSAVQNEYREKGRCNSRERLAESGQELRLRVDRGRIRGAPGRVRALLPASEVWLTTRSISSRIFR